MRNKDLAVLGEEASITAIWVIGPLVKAGHSLQGYIDLIEY